MQKNSENGNVSTMRITYNGTKLFNMLPFFLEMKGEGVEGCWRQDFEVSEEKIGTFHDVDVKAI